MCFLLLIHSCNKMQENRGKHYQRPFCSEENSAMIAISFALCFCFFGGVIVSLPLIPACFPEAPEPERASPFLRRACCVETSRDASSKVLGQGQGAPGLSRVQGPSWAAEHCREEFWRTREKTFMRHQIPR